jgi:hypothetical protein
VLPECFCCFLLSCLFTLHHAVLLLCVLATRTRNSSIDSSRRPWDNINYNVLASYACVQEPQGTGGHRRRKVCLLGDTSDSRSIALLARGCDVLSHESTFLNEMADKARQATHSTGYQAGQFASLVQVISLSCSPTVRQPCTYANDACLSHIMLH